MSDMVNFDPQRELASKDVEGVQVLATAGRWEGGCMQVYLHAENGHATASRPVVLSPGDDLESYVAEALPHGDAAARTRLMQTILGYVPGLGSALADAESRQRYTGGRSRKERSNGHAAPATEPLGRGHYKHILTMAELLAEEHVERQDLVAGLFPLGQAGVVAAEGRAGKTLLMMQLALARARGGDFLGRETRPGRTLLCLFDDPRGLTKERCHQLFHEEDAVDVIVERYSEDSGVYQEIAHLIQHEEHELMVLDTLGTLLPDTPGAENDPSTMIAVMEPFIKLCNNEKTSVIFLHHTNNEGNVRGSTAIRYQVQWTFKMEPRGLDEAGNKKVLCTLEWKYEPVQPFFLLQQGGLFVPSDLAVPTAAPPAAEQPPAPRPPRKSHREVLLEVLGGDRCTSEQIYQRMAERGDAPSESWVYSTVKQLANQGILVELGPDPAWTGTRGHAPKLYGRAALPHQYPAALSEDPYGEG